MSIRHAAFRTKDALIVLGVIFVLGESVVHAAEPIVDQATCNAALSAAENAIVTANIDSTAFRVLNDHLVKIRALCVQQDFANAEAEMRAFNELNQ